MQHVSAIDQCAVVMAGKMRGPFEQWRIAGDIDWRRHALFGHVAMQRGVVLGQTRRIDRFETRAAMAVKAGATIGAAPKVMQQGQPFGLATVEMGQPLDRPQLLRCGGHQRKHRLDQAQLRGHTERGGDQIGHRGDRLHHQRCRHHRAQPRIMCAHRSKFASLRKALQALRLCNEPIDHDHRRALASDAFDTDFGPVFHACKVKRNAANDQCADCADSAVAAI